MGKFTSSKSKVAGQMSLKEQADAIADESGFGQLWVDSDNSNLYFTNDAGNDVAITNGANLAAPPSAGAVAADDINAGDAAVSLATTSGNVTVDSNAGSVSIDGHTGVTVASSNSGEVDITSAANIDINATTGIAIDATTMSIDGTDDSNLTVTASGKDLDLAVVGGGTQELRLASAGTGASAMHLNASAGGINIDAADMIDIDAADEITIDTTSADGHIAVTSAHTAGQSILISANANAGSILDIDAGIIDIDVQDTINIDAADEIEVATTSADGHITLTSAHTAGVAFWIDANADAASEVQIDAGILDIDVTGAATIDATSVTTTAATQEAVASTSFGFTTPSIIVGATGAAQPVLTLKNSGGSIAAGPFIIFDLDGGAGTDADVIGTIRFKSDDHLGGNANYTDISCTIIEADDGSETGKLGFKIFAGGTIATGMEIAGTAVAGVIDLNLSSDGTAVNFGADGEVTLTHVHDTGLLLSDASGIGTTKLMFGDSACFVNQAADGQLDAVADSVIQVTAPTVNIEASTAITLESDSITFGEAGDTDIVLNFNANSADGVLTWMEDEDFFKFSDDILMNSTERVQFGDTGTYIYQSTDGQLDIIADGLIKASGPLEIENPSDGGGPALLIDNDDVDKRALRIQAANTTQHVIDVDADALTTKKALKISADALTTGGALDISSSSTDTGAGTLVSIAQTGTRGSDSNTHVGLLIDYDVAAGTAARAFSIDSEQTTGVVAEIDGNAVTTGKVLNVSANALTSGNALLISSTSTSTTAGAVAKIAATGNRGDDSNSVIGLEIDFDTTAGTAARALYIDSEQTTGKVIYVDADAITTGTALEISVDALTTGKGFKLEDNSSNTGSREVARITQKNAAAIAATALKVQSKGGVYGMFLDKDYTDVAAATVRGLYLDFDQAAASGTATFTNIGIDLDVNGAGGGTITTTGMDIDVVGTSGGTSTAVGLSIDADGADTNIGMLINTAGTHIKLEANADTNDYATIALADTGDLTVTTVGSGTTDSDLTLTVDGDITMTAAGGDINMTSGTANAVGGGFDGAAGVTTYVKKSNGIIETTILVDIEGLVSSGVDKDIIGENDTAAAYITQITTAVNGIIFFVEMMCIETPAGTSLDLDLVTSSVSLAEDVAYDSEAAEVVFINSNGDWATGVRKNSEPNAALTAADHYLYLADGDGNESGGTFSDGKFIIKLYGANF